MAITAAQFNASTLKASYAAATSKAQTVDTYITSVCEWCTDTQPAWIDVTFHNFVSCGCIIGAPYSNNYVDIETVNGTWRVPFSSGCGYSVGIANSFGSISMYRHDEGTPCVDGHILTLSFNSLVIQLTLLETGVFILAHLDDPDPPGQGYGDYWCLFKGTILYSGSDSCGNTNNSANNELTECAFIEDDMNCVNNYTVALGGSVTIFVP